MFLVFVLIVINSVEIFWKVGINKLLKTKNFFVDYLNIDHT